MVDFPATSSSADLLARQLAPYVPRWLGPRLPLPAGYRETSAATVVVADLQGFTGLTQVLAAQPAGAEELRAALERIYTPLIAAIHTHDGDVIKFTGDGVLAAFPDDITAARAAHAMLAGLDPVIQTPAGAHPLVLRLGMGSGPLTWEIVGTPDLGLYWVASGAALDSALAAEAGAAGLRPRPAGHMAPWAPPAPGALPAADALAPYLPGAIVARMAGGLSGWVGEFRTLTAAFVALPAAGDLQTLVARALPLVARFGGRLNEVEVGDKGRLLVILFGAPVAHGDDAARGAGCLLALREAGILARGGMAVGLQYVGTVGAPGVARCTYTALGPEMNLAARLMQAAAPGEILISGRVWTALGLRFVCRERPALPVKGWAEPVPVARLEAPEDAAGVPAIGDPLGRDSELAQAAAVIAGARAGQPGLLRLVGEAGIGKSRLATTISNRAAGTGWRVLLGGARPDRHSAPYWPWQAPLAMLIAGRPEAALTWPAVEAAVARWAPARRPDAPLLADLLGVALPAAHAAPDAAPALDPATRAGATRTLLAALIAGAAHTQPLLIWLDDFHWADPLSWDLVRDLATATPPGGPLVLLLSHRPFDAPLPAAKEALAALPPHLALDLRELDAEAAAALVRQRATLPAPVVAEIVTRGQGHPFFLEELAAVYADQPAPDLPDTVQEVIQARIDRLDEAHKLTLKLASIFGRVFMLDALAGSYPPEIDAGAVPGHLQLLAHLDLTPLTDAAVRAYAFKHAMTQEVAYASLLAAQRQAAHDRAGDWFERTTPDNYSLLAYHYGRGANREKQRLYLRRAADAAQAAYANDSAIDYYERLLPLLAPAEQVPVLLQLGGIHRLVGHVDTAAALYRRALDQATAAGDARAVAEAQMDLGVLDRQRGAYTEALTWLEQARAGFTSLGDAGGLLAVQGHIGQVHWLQFDHPRALACFWEQMVLATDLGDRRGQGEAVGNLGNVYDDLGDYAQALSCLEQQLDIARSIGDRQQQERAHWSLGSVYQNQRDFGRALAAYGDAVRIAESIGDRRVVGLTVSGMGLIYHDYGDYAAALACFIYHLAATLSLGNRVGITIAVGNLALVYTRQDRAAEAEPLFAQAVALARTLPTRYYLPIYLYEQAAYYLAAGRVAEARAPAEEAAALAGEAGERSLQFKTAVLALRIRAAQGDLTPEAARAAWADLFAAWPEPDQQAALHYTLWRLDPTQDAARAAAATAYAALYAATPLAEYRTRYGELTGAALPPAPPLPPPPGVVTASPPNLPALLAQVATLLPPT
jgi:class 3 adenylate cyclase/tetratricopeptide (TPR) repeat protein